MGVGEGVVPEARKANSRKNSSTFSTPRKRGPWQKRAWRAQRKRSCRRFKNWQQE